jgi:predicted ATPase/DNA-binding CsgD family transcriptional regulator
MGQSVAGAGIIWIRSDRIQMMSEMAETSPKRERSLLPVELTSFIGRRREVAEVKALLSEARLVTLAGVGGVGKTRLALRIAADAERAFPDGVWLVELAVLDDPALLAQTVAETMELRGQSGRTPADVLVEHLRDRRALLVLDNCGHLLDECANLSELLLRAAPGLRILATSRQALGIDGEQLLAVQPLSLPPATGRRLGTRAIAQFDAVRLFVERARAVLPGFELTDANRDAVEGICRRLDGIPLALELAAVRLRALSVDQLLDRLDDRFRLLTGGSRAVLPRHRTLRALIDWSYEQCGERERELWARISVFAGGLDLEAAEAVCSDDGAPESPGAIARADVLDLVIGLVDKSVLIREEHPAGVRYRLLETIREYGKQRLAASGLAGPLRRRHRDHYRDLAARASGRLFGAEQLVWFTRLEAEHANLRTALAYSFAEPGSHGEPGEAAVGLAMATDLLYHWVTSAHLAEGRRWLDHGLAACPRRDETRARALWADAWLAILQAETGAAAKMLEEARELGERLGQGSILGYVALLSGMMAMYRGDAEEAIGRYEEALARHRAAGDRPGIALTLIRLALANSFAGDTDRAVAFGEECVALCDAHGERGHKVYAMIALAVAARQRGDGQEAEEKAKQALRLAAPLHDWVGVGLAMELLAWVAADRGRHARAARLLGVLETVWETIGAPLAGYGYLVRYHDACVADTSEALGGGAYADAIRRGAGLNFEEAKAYALEERVAEPASNGSRLTPRETEIAGLVARGLTNKEIASSLVISQRTAEGHIEHILAKLGFTSRSQVAVWMGERDPGDDDRGDARRGGDDRGADGRGDGDDDRHGS